MLNSIWKIPWICLQQRKQRLLAAAECSMQEGGGPSLAAVNEVCNEEIKCYLAAAVLKMTYKKRSSKGKEIEAFNNPLSWWKKNEKMFPNLAELVKICLAIPATSAPLQYC